MSTAQSLGLGPAPAEAAWFKSSYSGNEGGECVEVAATAGVGAGRVHVRDSKDREVPALAFTPQAWDAFVALISLR